MPSLAVRSLLLAPLIVFAGASLAQAQPATEAAAAAGTTSETVAAPKPAGDDGDRAEQTDDRPRRVRDTRPLTQEELQQAMEILREINPVLAQRVAEWQERSPEKISKLLGGQLPRLRQFLEVRQRDPEMFELMLDDLKLERRSIRLARSIRDAADQAQRQELTTSLRDTVNRHFEVRQTMRRRDLARLEKRLDDLREQLQQRQSERDEVIQKRLDDLASPESQTRRW